MELARLPHQADLRVVACHYLEALPAILRTFVIGKNIWNSMNWFKGKCSPESLIFHGRIGQVSAS